MSIPEFCPWAPLQDLARRDVSTLSSRKETAARDKSVDVDRRREGTHVSVPAAWGKVLLSI